MKRTILYAAITTVLVLTFILQESVDSRKNTIQVPILPGEVHKIVFESGNESLTLSKKDEDDSTNWSVGQEAFPADGQKISDLISATESLGRLDVISTRESYKKFGLQEDEQRILRFFSGDDKILAVRLGNKASSGNSVYARIQDQREVVLLPQDLSKYFSTEAADFRETQMASFSRERIDRMEITGPGHEKLLLSRQDREPAGTESSKSETTEETVWTAETATGKLLENVEEGRFRDLMIELADLRASGFPDKNPQGEPFANLKIVKNGGEQAVVSLWPPDEAGNFPVQVSTNSYSFTIPKWKARRLLLGLDRYFEDFEENGK
jgi:hypothetical protein